MRHIFSAAWWILCSRVWRRGPLLIAIVAMGLLAFQIARLIAPPSVPSRDEISAFEVGSLVLRARLAHRQYAVSNDAAALVQFGALTDRAMVMLARLRAPADRPPALSAALNNLVGLATAQIASLQRATELVRSGGHAAPDTPSVLAASEQIAELVTVAARAAQQANQATRDRPRRQAAWLLATSLGMLLAAAAWVAIRGDMVLRALAGLRGEMDRAGRTRTRFLAHASHDLRQPLHALNLYIGALHRRVTQSAGPLQADALLPLVDGLGNAARSMDRMFGALLDLARLDAGTMRPDFRNFALEELLDGLRGEYLDLAAAKQITCRIDPTALVVRSDPALLESILRNLIGNALRYTEAGGVSVQCRTIGTSWVLVDISDTGPGIPEAQRQLVFDEFHRLEGAAPGGLGLGLAIVKRLSALLGIDVQVTSSPGEGTTINLRIPLGIAEPANAGALPDETGLRGGRVLLLEHDNVVRAAMRVELADMNLRIEDAGTVIELLALAANQPRPLPRLVILDTHHHQGTPVASRLLWCFGRPVPILVVTADTAPETLLALETGALPYLIKPVAPAELRRAVGRLLLGATPEKTGA